MKYSFNNLRNRAKQRGHEFLLSFEDYQRFAIQTGYAELKGKTKYSLSIHRRDNSRGYERDNILAVTLSANARLQYANIPDWLKAEIEEAERKAMEALN